MKKILVTNDDGVHAPGLEALIQGLSGLGEIIAVVPNQERSSASHSLTLHHPLRVTRVRKDIYVTTGTPSDCVIIGMMEILKEKVDLVVSGINNGPNLGDDVTYSGTVAAGIEATLRGVLSFAVSVASFRACRYDAAAGFAGRLAGYVLKKGLPEGTFLNVNVPNIRPAAIKGVQITRMGKRIYRDEMVRRRDPRGGTYYWIGGKEPSAEKGSGTDCAAVARGWISVTPLQLDLTDYKSIKGLRNWRIKYP